MMNPVYINIGMSLLRHLVGAIGGYLVGKGVLDEATWQEITGGLLAIAAAVAGAMDKKRPQPETAPTTNFAEKPKPPPKKTK